MIISLNDFSINYTEYGSPDGQAIVFIHGFPFSCRMWDPQIAVLPKNFRAITYDVRGHGLSDIGDGQYTIEIDVDDLIMLLDQLKIKEAVICGLSMGGYIALRAIERNPERICGLILCDTKSEPDTNEAKIKRTGTIKNIKANGVGLFAEDFVRTIFSEEAVKNKEEAVSFIKKIILSNLPLGICGTLLALASRTDTTDTLPKIKVPTCIIVGEHDKLTPPSVAKTMAEIISDSELHIIPKSAHMSNLENSKEFNDKLNSFLVKHWS
jgi:3-oxoadipate enol-lactonase